MRKIMQKIVDSDDLELAYFDPGGWWVDAEKVSKKACEDLLRLCVIKLTFQSGASGVCYYKLTEEAHELFKNPDQIPLIIQALRKKA